MINIDLLKFRYKESVSFKTVGHLSGGEEVEVESKTFDEFDGESTPGTDSSFDLEKITPAIKVPDFFKDKL